MRAQQWVGETYGDVTLQVLRDSTRFEDVSRFQRVRIIDSPAYGATLLLDDAFMCAATVEHLYHEMLVHPALCSAEHIDRILVVGGGDGGSVREVLKHPEVREVVLCEIDAMVVDACKAYFHEMEVPWHDPRLTVRIGDGMDFVADAANGKFDVIIVDGADPVGPAATLFSTRFYVECMRRLHHDTGVLVSQTESPIAMRDDFLKIVHTMRDAFPFAEPYFGPMPIYPSGHWSYTIAGLDERRPALLQDRLAGITPRCRYFNEDIARAAYALPNNLKAALR